MANVNELLKGQIESSRNFPQQNFGLKVGKDWPEFVKDMLAGKETKQELVIAFMMSTLQAQTVFKRSENAPADDPTFMDKLAEEPGVYETPLKFLYWGIQIGKQMAEVQRLEEMAK